MLEYRVMSSIYLQTVGLTVKISILVIKLVFFRANNDKICDKYGRMLLRLCKTNNLLIVNGRIGNHSCGNLTFRNISTIVYFVYSPSLFQQIHNFAVNLLNPMISDGLCVLQLVFKPVQKICLQ